MAKSDESAQKNWNYTVTASTRVSDQTSEGLEQYQEQEDIGKSEALRRLIRTGLDHELADGSDEQDNENTTEAPPRHEVLFWIGFVLVAVILVGDPVWHVYPLTALILAGSAYSYWKHTTTTEQHDS